MASRGPSGSWLRAASQGDGRGFGDAVVAIVQVRDAREGFVAELTVIEPGAAATTRLYPPVDHCLVATARLADALAGFLADQPAPATAPGVTPVELGLRGPGGSPGPGTAPRSGWRR